MPGTAMPAAEMSRHETRLSSTARRAMSAIWAMDLAVSCCSVETLTLARALPSESMTDAAILVPPTSTPTTYLNPIYSLPNAQSYPIVDGVCGGGQCRLRGRDRSALQRDGARCGS